MKKIVAVIASLLLIAGAFSACGKTVATPTDAETTTGVVTDTDAVVTLDDAIEVVTPTDAD